MYSSNNSCWYCPPTTKTTDTIPAATAMAIAMTRMVLNILMYKTLKNKHVILPKIVKGSINNTKHEGKTSESLHVYGNWDNDCNWCYIVLALPKWANFGTNFNCSFCKINCISLYHGLLWQKTKKYSNFKSKKELIHMWNLNLVEIVEKKYFKIKGCVLNVAKIQVKMILNRLWNWKLLPLVVFALLWYLQLQS